MRIALEWDLDSPYVPLETLLREDDLVWEYLHAVVYLGLVLA